MAGNFQGGQWERCLVLGRTWVRYAPLKLMFPKSYEHANKNLTACDCFEEGEWRITFCRAFGQEEMDQWDAMLTLLQDVTLSDGNDRACWALERSGNYTTKSMYRLLAHRGVINKRMQRLWGCRLPLKIKVYVCLACQGRLQRGVALKRRGWKESERCVVCEESKFIGKFLLVRIWRRTKTEWFRLLTTQRGCHLLLKSGFLQELRSYMQEEGLERTKKFGSAKVCLGSSFAEHNRMKRNLFHFKYFFLLKRRKEEEENRKRAISSFVYKSSLYRNSTYCSGSPFTRKIRIKRIELPTHYLEVNHRTLKSCGILWT
jgi:hypothetical protein